MAYLPPSGIGLEHLQQLLARFRRPDTGGGIQGALNGHRSVMSQVGVPPILRTMPAAVLNNHPAHGVGNFQLEQNDQYAPTNAGQVAAGAAAPSYPTQAYGAPNAAQTGGGLSPILQALLRGAAGRGGRMV